MLSGSETIHWRNTTSSTTDELWLHLYLNAFASSESTFMREMAADPMAASRVMRGGWGWTRITRMVLVDGSDLLPAMVFERPDDGNPNDFTVARVELPHEVLPGESVTLELDFEARLPDLVVRTGVAGDFFMVAQWFPKLGVLTDGGWSCHQFHAASEFFADFGTYDVTLTVPRGWVVGATGYRISREPVGTGDRLVFRAPAVHDFAWTTAPPSLMTVVEAEFEPGRHVPQAWLARAMERLDVPAATLELAPVGVRLLVPRSQQALLPRMLRAARLAMAWFGLHFGQYPYPQLTVVSPPPGAGGAGGMEYPTLITTGASSLDKIPPFAWSAEIEGLTAHELGHQYFQGVLAFNEFEQAWLDEGLTSWATAHCIDDMHADGLLPGVRWAPTWELDRLWMSFEDLPVTVDRPVWRHRRLLDVKLASYSKPALVLRTLEGIAGQAAVLNAVRDFSREHRFTHPTGDDLQASLERSLGLDLAWFFDGLIHGDGAVDWAVLSVHQHQADGVRGMTWTQRGWVPAADSGDSVEVGGEKWRVVVEIGRRGEVAGPVEVELEWADGRRERRHWDGRERWMTWDEESVVRLRGVVVDPDGVWVLETDRADNYWRDEPADRSPVWWLGQATRLMGLPTVPWS